VAYSTTPRLITSGIIAAKLGEPMHRVLNILSTRKHIRVAARAGTIRLFSSETIGVVRDELAAIDAHRKLLRIAYGVAADKRCEAAMCPHRRTCVLSGAGPPNSYRKVQNATKTAGGNRRKLKELNVSTPSAQGQPAAAG